MRFQKLLCPVDYSDASRRAMETAAELARDWGAGLLLVHVCELPGWVTGYETQLPRDLMAELFAADEAQLHEWSADARKRGAREVTTRFLEGSPWDQIVSTARDDHMIDLIVMGTHGRTGLQRAVIGSVTERVVRHAPCAVMVVRAAGAA